MGFFEIFKKKDEEVSIGTTTISKGTKIENGELSIEGDLIIEGEYSGNITTTKGVIIGKTGKITGKVVATNIILNGVIEGEVDCNMIEVLDGARLSGSVISNKLKIGDGGIFEGVIKKK